MIKTMDKQSLIPKKNENLVYTKKFMAMADRLEKIWAMNDGKSRMYAPLIFGDAGVGKNEVVSYVCHKTNKPLLRVNCSGDMGSSSLIGRYAPDSDGNITYQYGFLTIAVRDGYTIELDEGNAIDSEVLFALHGVLDYGELVLPDKSVVITAHPDFRLVVTANPSDYYVGTKPMNQALLDRFTVLWMDFDEEVDTALLSTIKTTKEVRNGLYSVIKALRSNYPRNISQNFGHRTLKSVADLSKHFPLTDALQMAYVNKLPASDSQLNVVQSIITDFIGTVNAYGGEAVDSVSEKSAEVLK